MKLNEKIINITEEIFELSEKYYEGYVIETDKQKIKIGISNVQNCCEDFGYFMTNDNIENFIGTDLFEIQIVDTALNNKKIEEIKNNTGYNNDSINIMFVNFETSNSTLQFTVYNAHNGYYGHNAVVVSEQLNKQIEL